MISAKTDVDTFSELLAAEVELKEDGQPLHRYLAVRAPLVEGVFIPTQIVATVLSASGWMQVVAELAECYRCDECRYVYLSYALSSKPACAS